MKGLFELRSADDMMAKLEYEHQKLAEEPLNSYHAFNFFVTAWHMREWHTRDKAVQKKLRDNNPILGICEHLAIGAKHFDPDSRHDSVIEAKTTTVWGDGVWAEGAWAEGAWAEWLVVKLDGEARDSYGESIRVDRLSDLVIEFWRGQLDITDQPE